MRTSAQKWVAFCADGQKISPEWLAVDFHACIGDCVAMRIVGIKRSTADDLATLKG